MKDVPRMTDKFEKAARLREAREKKYETATLAADALGVARSTYRAHENGQNNLKLEDAKIYGKKFDVDPLWLMCEEGIASPSTQNDSPNAVVGAKIVGAGKMIKVYGQAVGGVDGEFDMNGSVLYEVMAPPILSDVRGAYGVQVAGDSMYPRYEDGEVCFVDPHRRVKKGDYVIVQIRHEEHGPLLAYVKKFVRHNAEELVLSQFNPEKELRFPANHVVTVHYIALAGNA